MAKIEITEEMLDAIEAVKGRREANYWETNVKDTWRVNKILKKM